MEYYDLRLLEKPKGILGLLNVIIHGAGSKGKEIIALLQQAGINVQLVCDIDETKVGETLNGVEVTKPDEVLQIESECLYIIACVERCEEVWELYSNILNYKKTQARFISYWGISQFLFSFRNIYYKNNKEQLWRFEKDIYQKKVIIKKMFLEAFEKSINHSNEILVAQAGKVGSTSLCHMLDDAHVSNNQVHQFSYPYYVLDDFESEWNKGIKELLSHEVRIISIVRNPLERDYSAFWQPFGQGLTKNRMIFAEKSSVQDMYDKFTNHIIMDSLHDLANECGCYMPSIWLNDEFSWFDSELKQFTNIDIWGHQFDKEKGYEIVRGGNIEVFLMKLEAIDRAIPALSKFCNCDFLNIKKDNSAENKWYSMAYKEFRKEVKISRDYVNYYFSNNPKFDYFYDTKEKESFILKWKDNICDFRDL